MNIHLCLQSVRFVCRYRSCTSYWTHWSEDEEQYQNNICFGNLQDEVYNAFAKLNIIGLIQILQSWQTYKCGVTGPLNYSFFNTISRPRLS